MSSKAITIKETFYLFFRKHGRFFLSLSVYFLLFFVVHHVFASNTQGDLASVDKHVKSEVTGDIVDIAGWVCFGLGIISAVAKMNLGVIITMFGIFLLLILGPEVFSSHFSALI